jgi:hypothetical protein
VVLPAGVASPSATVVSIWLAAAALASRESGVGAKAAKRGRFLIVRSPTSGIASHSSADTCVRVVFEWRGGQGRGSEQST